MNEERKKILDMLASGKINVEQCEKLLTALSVNNSEIAKSEFENKGLPKYMYVKVDSKIGDKVNIRIPMKILQAGIKFSSVLPAEARDKVNVALEKKGINMDLKALNPENIQEFVEGLSELTVDVESENGDRVKIYCE